MAEQQLPNHEIFWANDIPMRFFQPKQDAEAEHDAHCPLQARFPASRDVDIRDYGRIERHGFRHDDATNDHHWYCFAVRLAIVPRSWLSADEYEPIFTRPTDND